MILDYLFCVTAKEIPITVYEKCVINILKLTNGDTLFQTKDNHIYVYSLDTLELKKKWHHRDKIYSIGEIDDNLVMGTPNKLLFYNLFDYTICDTIIDLMTIMMVHYDRLNVICDLGNGNLGLGFSEGSVFELDYKNQIIASHCKFPNDIIAIHPIIYSKYIIITRSQEITVRDMLKKNNTIISNNDYYVTDITSFSNDVTNLSSCIFVAMVERDTYRWDGNAKKDRISIWIAETMTRMFMIDDIKESIFKTVVFNNGYIIISTNSKIMIMSILDQQIVQTFEVGSISNSTLTHYGMNQFLQFCTTKTTTEQLYLFN